MKNTKDFINRVTNKMVYNPSDYTVIENSEVYEEVKEDIVNALDDGMVFIEGTCIPDSVANQIAKEYNSFDTNKVITCDVDNGVSIIVPFDNKSELIEGVNVQSLGVINAFLNEYIKSKEPLKEVVLEVFTKKGVVQPDIKEVMSTKSDIKFKKGEPIEHIPLKDYYRLNLPDNKIGRKSDETLTKELEEAGFKV